MRGTLPANDGLGAVPGTPSGPAAAPGQGSPYTTGAPGTQLPTQAGASPTDVTVSLPPTVVPGPSTAPLKPVEVGIYYFNLTGLAKTFHVNPDALGNPEQSAEGIVDAINKQGGLGGHRIIPVAAFVDLASTTPYALQYQAACDHFTQDHHVIAVVGLNVGSDGLMETCLGKRGVPY